MSVCAAAPSPCLPSNRRNVESPKRRIAETSNRRNVESPNRRNVESPNRRNVESPKRKNVTKNVSAIRRFGYTSNRRENVSAAKRFGGNVFRRFVCTLWGYRVGCAVRRADRRIGGLPSTPRRRKGRKGRKGGGKIGMFKIGTSRCSTWSS